MLEICKKHPFVTFFVYFLFYQFTFFVLEMWERPVTLIESSLDAYIPFAPSAVVPYVGWFLWVPIALFWFLRTDIMAYWKFFWCVVIGNTTTLIIYVLFPNGLNLRPELVADDIFTKIVSFIYTFDTSTNVCPSLHTSVTIITFLIFCDLREKMPKAVLGLQCLIALSICASTVLLKQHSILDVIWGIVLALAVYVAVGFAMEKQKSEIGLKSIKRIKQLD